MLARMCQSDFKPCEDDNAYFIDRDPNLFKIIMEFIRKGYLKEIDIDKEELIEEAKYFMLDELVEYVLDFCPPISWQSPSTSHTINNNLAALISGKFGCLLSNEGFTTGVHNFSIKVISRISTCMLGVAPSNVSKSSINYNSTGFYMNLADGSLYSGAPYSYQNRQCLGQGVNGGSMIILILDCNKHTLTYNYNGIEFLAYENLPRVQLFLAFDNTGVGTEAELEISRTIIRYYPNNSSYYPNNSS